MTAPPKCSSMVSKFSCLSPVRGIGLAGAVVANVGVLAQAVLVLDLARVLGVAVALAKLIGGTLDHGHLLGVRRTRCPASTRPTGSSRTRTSGTRTTGRTSRRARTGTLTRAVVASVVVTADLATSLATLSIDTKALVVLPLASILASSLAVRAAIRAALGAVVVSVKLVWVAVTKVTTVVVAGDERELNTTDRVARTISISGIRRLLADTSRGRDDTGRCSRSDCAGGYNLGGGSRARIDGSGG